MNFGGGAYGIEAASQRYFNKPAAQLTLGEAALLAATMKGPSRYNPAANSDRAAKRATVVLDEMVRDRARSPPAQRDAAFAQPVRVSAHPRQPARAVFHRLARRPGARAGRHEPTEDLVVETTLDLPIQAAAEQAVRAGVAAHAGQGVQQGALVALDGEGRIRAYVGGADYADSQFDRATQAQRQAGSAFKPFVYLTAMEAGPHAAASRWSTSRSPSATGRRSNYTGRYLGPITLETALAQSINTVAARLANEVGHQQRRRDRPSPRHHLADPDRSLHGAGRGGGHARWRWPRPMTPSPTAAIGSSAYGIERIRTAAGQVLYDHGVGSRRRGRR